MQGPLQLGLSKWDLETPADLPSAFDAVEIVLTEYLSLSPKKRQGLRRAIQQKKLKVQGRHVLPRTWNRDEPSQELEELFKTAEEEWAAALQGWTIAAGSKRLDRVEGHPALAAAKRALLSTSVPVFFEWGEEDDRDTAAFLANIWPGAGRVLDPDIHSPELRRKGEPGLYKLHGWHPDRWVRRYGPRIDLLVSLIRSHSMKSPARQVTTLFLAHSGRWEEAECFKRSLNHES